MRYVLVLIVSLIMCVLSVEDSRPAYHFTAPQNWQNDPNGPLYWAPGENYHLFYQYNPNAAVWGDIHWGHAVSKDLINWEHLPIALYPDESYDRVGVWSGSAIIHEGQPIVYYTGVSGASIYQVQCIATPTNLSDPNLIEWEKYSGNPVLEISESIFSSGVLQGFRDPSTPWQHDGVWYMLVGSGTDTDGGLVFLYKSTDLYTWSFVSNFFAQAEKVNNFYECPDYFTLRDKSVLKYSQINNRMDTWAVGTVDYETDKVASVPRFVADELGYVDYGINTYYASKSFADDQNTRFIWGWLNENDATANWIARGWAGVQTVREVLWEPELGLVFRPLEALQDLRENHTAYPDLNLTPDQLERPLLKTEGNQLEFEFKISNYSSADKWGINVLSAEDGSEYTTIFFTAPSGLLSDVNFSGGTYKTVIIPSGDETICQNYCEQDNICFAWSFQVSNVSCYLKTAFCPVFTDAQGFFSGHKGLFGVDRTESSTRDPVTSDQTQCATYTDIAAGPIPGQPEVPVQIFVDHSVIEVFVNGGKQVLSTRVYPGSRSTHVNVWAHSGYVTFAGMQTWNLKAATFTDYQQNERLPVVDYQDEIAFEGLH